jgi:bifunctional non-homologous end joining protein LigD
MTGTGKFVIQKHTRAGKIHWDFMLEAGDVLETYRLNLPPEKLIQEKCSAVRIFNHPLKFLTYEGSVNKGKGRVKIGDSGTYQLLGETQNRKELQICGKILKGKFTLTHIKDKEWEFGRD